MSLSIVLVSSAAYIIASVPRELVALIKPIALLLILSAPFITKVWVKMPPEAVDRTGIYAYDYILHATAMVLIFLFVISSKGSMFIYVLIAELILLLLGCESYSGK